jgi:hypothetical protein
MRQASQASINPRSSPQGANKRSHGPIPPNWPRRAAQSRRDLCLRRPQTTPSAFLHSLGHSLPIHSAPALANVGYAPNSDRTWLEHELRRGRPTCELITSGRCGQLAA